MDEKIEVLALLATGPEAALRARALRTLEEWDYTQIRQVLASPLTAHHVLRFAAEHLVAGHEELRQVLLWNPSLPQEARLQLESQAAPPLAPSPAPAPAPPAAPPPPGTPHGQEEVLSHLTAALHQDGDKVLEMLPEGVEVAPEITREDDELTKEDRDTLIEKVGRMSAVEKIKAALTGNMETRMLLIRDPNKVVARAVLSSPKISESEMEGYAGAKNVSEEVLRLISINRKFMKAYVVMRALINNPRAPIDITAHRLNRLTDRDLKGVALNRNIPETLRNLAMKLIKQKEEATKVKPPGKH
jgi:hypothetical protein